MLNLISGMKKQARSLSEDRKEYYKRLNVVIAEGLRVFGDLTVLLQWMKTRNPELDNERPNDLMEKVGGYDKIYNLLKKK